MIIYTSYDATKQWYNTELIELVGAKTALARTFKNIIKYKTLRMNKLKDTLITSKL